MATKEIGRFTRKRVGVIGGNAPEPAYIRVAEEMGFLIAECGYLLVNGGMKGIMEASARGAHSSGGVVIGISPVERQPKPTNSPISRSQPGWGTCETHWLSSIRTYWWLLTESMEHFPRSPMPKFSTNPFWESTPGIFGAHPVSNPREAIQRIKDYFDGQL